MNAAGATATVDDFAKLDVRVARIVHAEPLAGARKPAFALTLDAGPLGALYSSAQLTALYTAEELVGKLVLAVVNLPPRRVAGFESEALVLGVYNSSGRGGSSGAVTLVVPDGAGAVMPGDRLG